MRNSLEVIKTKPKEIAFSNARFLINPNALPARHKDFWGQFSKDWEIQNKKILSSFVDSNTTVIDLGAWVGAITLLCASLGAKHVYAFEPDQVAYKFLKENYALNPKLQGNITISDLAVSQTDGDINIGPLPTRNLGESTTSINGSPLISVPAIGIDTLLQQCDIESAQKICIKIDIEGSEKYILRQITETLSRTKTPFLIIIEIHSFHFNQEDSHMMEEVIQQMISISDNFIFTQRRRIGEIPIYSSVEDEWRTELYHPNGLFDISFTRK